VLAFVIRRLMQAVLVMAVMSGLVFVGLYVVGDPVSMMASPEATDLERDEIRANFGLDKPLWQQYGIFMSHALQLDFGKSFLTGQSAMGLILERMPATLELAIVSMGLSMLVGVPLGIWAGLRPNAMSTRGIMTGSVLGFSLPNFWVGLMLIMVFAVKLGWLPSSGRGETVNVLGVPLSFLTWDGLQHLLLPALNLALFNIALVIRLTRAGAQEALQQDYVRFARAKGLSNSRIIGVHVLKNILIPIVTVLALQFGSLIAFAIVTETVFAWPGMGKLIIDSIRVLDRPVIVAYLMLIVTLFIVINLVVDLLYSLLDPRVRLGDAR
jgi:peptide/nickel transport system permease protein